MRGIPLNASQSAGARIRRVAWPEFCAGGRRPFGFEILEGSTEKERRLVPNPIEMAAIDEMRGMRAAGASLRWIAQKMTERGFSLSHTGVRRILNDEWEYQPTAIDAE